MCVCVCVWSVSFVSFGCLSDRHIVSSCCCTLLLSFVCSFVRLVSFLRFVVPGLSAVVAAVAPCL